jgi:hypothetical protein
MLQRTLPPGFIALCLPTKTDKLPSGSQWLHEIKHDRFRVIARKDGPRVRLSVAVATPIEQVVDAHLHHLDVSVALGESVAGEE